MGDSDASDGVAVDLMNGTSSEVEVDVAPESLPEGVTSVTASITYANPRDARDLFPGNYRASDDTQGEVQLESTVYAFVELRDQDGNVILSTNDGGQPANIRMKIPDDQWVTLQDMTPNDPNQVTVPLYFFDYEAGVWREADTLGHLETENGTLIQQSDLPAIWSGSFSGPIYMAGQVTHFSQWNVDYPLRTHASVCGQIVDITGSPIQDAQVRSYGTTYLSNFAKPQYTSLDGTFCDDYKKSEEEEPEEEEERTPPAVQVIEAGMSSPTEFRARVAVRYQGDATSRTLNVTVELTNQGETTPFATLTDQMSGVEKGPIIIDFPFNLEDEGVPRFEEHVNVHVEATAQETWADPTEILSDTDDRDGRILLPVIITHGITGDFAATSLGGYSSVGPGLPETVASLAPDGYRTGGPYPTAYTLVYPSLHVAGIGHISQNHLKPLVDSITTTDTYADRVDIVAHSMGGLVSRYYIEEAPGLNNWDKVRKLVMVGTPNEGAAGSHVGLEGEGFFTLSADTLMTVGELAGIYGATGETDIALATTKQLLPDYQYYREEQCANALCSPLPLPSTTWVPSATGYGYPTDPGMDLQMGSSSRLGPNTFLSGLNADGLDSRVDNFIIYRNNHDTMTTLVRTEGVVSWSTAEEMAPGDATVPERSAIMSDYSPANLKKCLINGGIHAEMFLDPNIRLMVRAILTLDEGEEPPGCNPQNQQFAPDEDRLVVQEALKDFLIETKAHSHPPKELSFTVISGFAGELRRLEDRSPSVLSGMGDDIQAYIQGLSDQEVSDLTDALQRWGLDTGALWRHAPAFGLAVEAAVAATDADGQRTALQGMVDSYLHNVAQGMIQMMLYAAAKSHSEEEAGQYSTYAGDLQALHGLLNVMATTRQAQVTWPKIGPVITALAGLTAGPDADEKVVELEHLLLALAGEEEFSSWTYKDSDGGLQTAPAPDNVKGGGERAHILVIWDGKIYTPGESDDGTDWQDIGIPRQPSASTGWVGNPSLSSDAPARWIGTVTLQEAGQRAISGTLVDGSGNPVEGVGVEAAIDVRTSWGSQLKASTTSDENGQFSLQMPQGVAVRVFIPDRNIRPEQPLPLVPPDVADFDLGDIAVVARPVINNVSATPNRPERGQIVTLSVDATSPLGQPLTYNWERRTSRWEWVSIGTAAQVQFTMPDTPQTQRLRVTVSASPEVTGYISVTPQNQPPSILSLDASSTQVIAGQQVGLAALAQDPDGDPLDYRWGVRPGWWWPRPDGPTATWTAPWTPEDRTYTISLQVSDGALYDLKSVEITVEGRPEPVINSFSMTPNNPLTTDQITFSADASDAKGQIVKYEWSVQKQSAFFSRYYYWSDGANTSSSSWMTTLAQPANYRARVTAVNDLDIDVQSDWIFFRVRAAPTVSLSGIPLDGIIPLQVDFTAAASDQDGTVVEYRWDFDGDSSVDATGTAATASHTYQSAGTFQAMVTVVDDEGLTGTDTVTVTPRMPVPPTVGLGASPSDGIIPLDVDFTATASDDGQVVEYRWDFDGDSSVDATGTTAAISHTYPDAGTFQPMVTVVDNDGLTGTDTVTVTPRTPIPPTVSLAADPTSGEVPLPVNFTATANDTDGSVVQYRWDFDGNGSVDTTTATSTVSHTYSSDGAFPAMVTVVDNDGLEGTSTPVTITVEPPSLGVNLAADPSLGTAPLEVQFTADALQPGKVTLYEWDFNGDRSADATGTAPTATYTYNDPGTFVARVTVTYQDGLGTFSDTETIRVFPEGGAQHPIFDAPFGFPIAQDPSVMDVDDLNGDGLPDLVMAANRNSLLLVLPGIAGGSFGDPESYPLGVSPGAGRPQDLLVADFDGQNGSDVAVALQGTQQVAVFLRQSDGALGTSTLVAVSGDVIAIDDEDMDNDGNPDILALSATGPPVLDVLLGNGDGNFQAASTLFEFVPSAGVLLDADDFNNDAFPDVMVGHGTGLTLIPGTGDSSSGVDSLFGSPQDIPLPGDRAPLGMEVTDWDEDGNLDLVITLSQLSPGKASVLFGDGNGAFPTSAEQTLTSPDLLGPQYPIVGDFDGDGNDDLGVTDRDAGLLFVQRGTGEQNPAFQGDVLQYPLLGGDSVSNVDPTAVDLTGDSNLDLAVLHFSSFSAGGSTFVFNSHVLLFPGLGDGSFLGNVDLLPVSSGQDIALGNQGPDSRPDLVVSTGDAVDVWRWQQNQGSYQLAQSMADTTELGLFGELIPGDFTATSTATGLSGMLVMGSYETSSIFVLPPRPQADGLFDPPIETVTDFMLFDPMVGDFDEDGDDDLLAGFGDHGGYCVQDPEDPQGGLVPAPDGGLVLFSSNGDGTFAPPTTILNQTFGLRHPAIGDINGDNHLDVVVTSLFCDQQGGATAHTLLGNGNGSFGETQPISGVTQDVFQDLLADMNGDSNLDLLIIGDVNEEGRIFVLEGQGDGTFAAPQTYEAELPFWMLVDDWNGDGFPDVGFLGSFLDGVYVMLNAGDGSLTPPVGYFTGNFARSLLSGNIDSDNASELLLLMPNFIAILDPLLPG